MSQEYVELTRRFYREVIDQGRLETVDELCSEDFVDHEEFPGITPDREGVKQFFTMLRTAFPDLHCEIDDLIDGGDRIVARVRFQGTHQGEFMGVPASGQKIDVPAIDVIRVVDGRATEHWGVFDAMLMMQQLGAIPAPAPA